MVPLVVVYFVCEIRIVAFAFLLRLLFSVIVSGLVDRLDRRGLGRP